MTPPMMYGQSLVVALYAGRLLGLEFKLTLKEVRTYAFTNNILYFFNKNNILKTKKILGVQSFSFELQ